MFNKIIKNLTKSALSTIGIGKKNDKEQIKKQEEESEQQNADNKKSIFAKDGMVDNIVDHSKNLFSNFFLEFENVKSKFNNLLETNYNQGLWHIEKNNINEAIFRFRFIKKFWPKHYDSWYQLAYCLHKKNKNIIIKI